MQSIEKVSEMQSWSEAERRRGGRIGFVPTMGSLHGGHLSLIRYARGHADAVVVSIFVNPIQFGPREDFAAYPRDLEKDLGLLEQEGVDVLFHPGIEEMYPRGFETRVDVSRLSALLCGAERQGHFQGVATVVAKLFNGVRPHIAVFGEKDYQQLQVVRTLVRDLNFDIEVVGRPTVREADGLAMSSRNAYLTPSERQAAACLHRALERTSEMAENGELRAGALIDAVKAEIVKEPLARLEYAKLCDTATLAEVERIRDSALLALAVRIGKTRLIDNRIIKGRQE